MTENRTTNRRRRPARPTSRQVREAKAAKRVQHSYMSEEDKPRSRSIRISDVRWYKAKRRAEREGVTISRVAQELIEGYAEGDLDRPQMVFSSSATVRRSRYTEPGAPQADS